MEQPDHVLYYFEYFESNKNTLEQSDIFLGTWISNGNRELVSKLSLKTRVFIGNTSMEPQLALIMVNQGLVCKGDVVYDPFV